MDGSPAHQTSTEEAADRLLSPSVSQQRLYLKRDRDCPRPLFTCLLL